jgi:hypothetical protein
LFSFSCCCCVGSLPGAASPPPKGEEAAKQPSPEGGGEGSSGRRTKQENANENQRPVGARSLPLRGKEQGGGNNQKEKSLGKPPTGVHQDQSSKGFALLARGSFFAPRCIYRLSGKAKVKKV